MPSIFQIVLMILVVFGFVAVILVIFKKTGKDTGQDDKLKQVHEEMEKINKRMGLEQPKHKMDFNVNEVVSITDGPFKGFDGTINEIDAAKGKLKVLVSMFGRETPVELDSLQVKRV